MRVAVTGASGNVGTSLLADLSEDDRVEAIVGICRRPPAWRPAKVEWAQADVGVDDLVPHFRGADVVVHLAWMIQPSHRAEAIWRTNVVGSRRVFEATAEAGVGALVHASSVGAYAPATKTDLVDESWPTDGLPSLDYSWQKAYVERLLDRVEDENPHLRVVRLRPALTFKSEAASEIRRLFFGPLFPNRLVPVGVNGLVARLPVCFQAVHTDDVAEAYSLAVTGSGRGAFNLAAAPVLGSRPTPRVLHRVTRTAAAAMWHSRLVTGSPGWLDLLFSAPLMDVTRASRELGWQPRRSSIEAVEALAAGLRVGEGFPTPPLQPSSSGTFRLAEVETRLPRGTTRRKAVVARPVREIMTRNPVTLDVTAPLVEAAATMRDQNIGEVIVMDDGQVTGVLTDRDIVVRALAEQRDPNSTKVGDICSGDPITVAPHDSAQDAARIMRERAIRRLPVVENGRPVGVVSIGDLAIELDAHSALADASAAPPNT